MEVFALPGPISNSELKLLEAALQGLPFPALPACRGFLPCEFVQILANKASQRRVAIYRNFANAFHQLFWQRQRDIHVPIIRDSLILCNVFTLASVACVLSGRSPAFSTLRNKTPYATLAKKRRITERAFHAGIAGSSQGRNVDRAHSRPRSAGRLCRPRPQRRYAHCGPTLSGARSPVGEFPRLGERRSHCRLRRQRHSPALHAPGRSGRSRSRWKKCCHCHADGFRKDALLQLAGFERDA